MTGMTVDTASANRWYHRIGCATPCQTLYIEICPPAPCCLPVECCHESVGVVEPSTASPTVSAEADTTVSPDPGPAPTESAAEDVVAAPETDAPPQPEVSQPESSIVNKPAPVTDEAKISPPPVSVPQPSLDAAEVPAVEETTPEPDADSLFNPPAAAVPEPLPAESLPDDSPAADLFDEPTTPETPKAETPVEATSTDQADPLDDLLPPSTDKSEPPADLTPEESAPKEPAKESPDEKKDTTLDDLFGQQPLQPILSEPGGLASHSVRVWTDDGARFHCEARLQQVTAKTVVLLKNNGKRIAVFFSRLSDSDLQFVRRQVVAQRELLAQRAAAEQLASR